jgi:nucleotide-binding universal stress UspA family protein
MLKNIVVPLDGSFTAGKILPWARNFALQWGARLHLVRAVPDAGWSNESEHARVRERNDSLRYLGEISKELNQEGFLSEVWVREGRPAETVMEVCRKARAGLVTITTRGATTVRRGLFGGTAEKILRMRPPALFIMHASEEEPRSSLVRLKKILVPLDGSPLSESVLSTAAELARGFESALLLATVRAPRSFREVETGGLDAICEKLQKAGIPATHTHASGDPATEIMRLAEKKKARMIVMNSHGRSGFSRFFMGSVSEEVVHGAGVPVYLTFHRMPKGLVMSEARPVGAGESTA